MTLKEHSRAEGMMEEKIASLQSCSVYGKGGDFDRGHPQYFGAAELMCSTLHQDSVAWKLVILLIPGHALCRPSLE